METIVTTQSQTNVELLSAWVDLLAKAKQRRTGYLKWDKSAIWFTDLEQKHRIDVINMAIERIRNRCTQIAIDLVYEL